MRARAELYLLDQERKYPLVWRHCGRTRVMRHRLAALCVCMLLLGLWGRASGAPAPAGPAKSVAPASYVLGPGDEIDVQVFGDSDLSRVITIKPDGMIALPLINEVRAAGKT